MQLSVAAIKKQYGQDSIIRFEMDVLNTAINTSVTMRVRKKCVPLKIDSIRHLSTQFYPYEEQKNFCSDEKFKRVVINKLYISLIPITPKQK